MHYSIIKFYNDGQITCGWHSGRKICEHKVLFGEGIGLSLTEMRQLHDKVRKTRYNSDIFIVKPVSVRRIPVHPIHRYVLV